MPTSRAGPVDATRPQPGQQRPGAGSTGDEHLTVADVSVTFGGHRAVDAVSLAARRGEVFGIIGPNGAGKSTLLRSIAGIQKIDAGHVHLAGRDVTTLDFWKRCRLGLALTFQIPRGSAELTVAEQLAAAYRGYRHLRLGPRARGARRRVEELVDALDLGHALARRSDELTLGEIRRFEVARAMINSPSVLLVDEPSSGMTAEEAGQLATVLRRLCEDGVCVVLIEHNIPFIASMTSRLLVLDAGQAIAFGPTTEVLRSPAVEEAYLGRPAS